MTLVVTLVCGDCADLLAEEKSRSVTVTVICDGDAAKKMIRDSLLKHLRALRDLEVVEKGGYSSLIVYAEKTVHDPRNPNGYVFAVAHINSYELRLAYKNLRGIDDVKVQAVRSVVERALRDDTGLLRHINVAHLDELPNEKLDELTKRLVSDFHQRQKETDRES